MSIDLPPELEEFVDREVAAGRFRTRSEVVSQALALMRDREAKLASLRAEIQVGLDDLANGRFVTIASEEDELALLEDIRAMGRARLAGS